MAMTPVPQVDPALAAQYKAAANAFTAKNWQNGVASPVAAQVPMPSNPTQYAAAANAFTAKNWTNGTANGLTDSQNLANVVNQPGNTVAQNPTPYIQKVLGQAASDTAAQVPKPQGTFNTLGSAGDGNSAPMGAVPPPSAPSAPKFDAAGIAASRVAAQRAALAGSVAAYDASRKQGFDYATKNMQDQRVLDNAMFHETNNPFGGKYQYDKTNILRNNNIQDTQNQMQYNNDIAASDAKLAAFDAGAPGMQQDLQQQLEHQNLQDTLATNQDTRAQQTQDHNFSQDTINNNRNAANDAATYTGNYTSPQTAALLQKQKDNSSAYATASPAEQDRLHKENIAISQQLGQTYDPGTGTYSGGNTSSRTIAGQTLDMNNAKDMAMLTGYMSDGKGGYMPTNAKQQQDLANAWTATNNLGRATPELSRLTGIEVGTPTQQAINQAQQIQVSNRNAANSENSVANSKANMEQDNLMNIWKVTGKAPAGIPGVAEGTPIAQAQNANLKSDKEISDLLDSSPFVTKQLDDNGKVIGTTVSDTNKKQMAQYIASLDLPVAEAKKWFIRYGLSLTGN